MTELLSSVTKISSIAAQEDVLSIHPVQEDNSSSFTMTDEMVSSADTKVNDVLLCSKRATITTYVINFLIIRKHKRVKIQWESKHKNV
jgi:hypothetical protein